MHRRLKWADAAPRNKGVQCHAIFGGTIQQFK